MGAKRMRLSAGMRCMEAASCMIILGAIGLTLLRIPDLPAAVPVHFGLEGPDRWGSPMELVALPIIMLACIALLSGVLHLLDPARWNSPRDLAEDEREDWQRRSAWSLVATELLIALFSLVAQVVCLDAAAGIASADAIILPLIGLVVALAAVYLALIGGFYRARRRRER